MKLLKNKEEFEEWKSGESGVYAEEPDMFPCYVYKVVHSWGYEEESTIYLYTSNLRKMLSEMETVEKQEGGFNGEGEMR